MKFRGWWWMAVVSMLLAVPGGAQQVHRVETVGVDAGGGMKIPDLSGATAWINTPNGKPLRREDLRGKVVVVDFWTYSCINCLRAMPYVKAWYDKYKNDGLVVIGVHAPEFPFEKDEDKVRRAVAHLGVTYPVAMDNNLEIWRGFNNEYWPAHYFIDANGRIRYHHFGEGEYEQSEQWIRELLAEAHHAPAAAVGGKVAASGVMEAPDFRDVRSPETYIGYERAKSFASPGGFRQDGSRAYALPQQLQLNDWALDGKWHEADWFASLESDRGAIAYRFHARDLHLVLGLAKGKAPIRFRVTIDGKAPGADHGVDVDAAGYGVVNEHRLYQLVRQSGTVEDRLFTIEFLGAGVEAFSFTFG